MQLVHLVDLKLKDFQVAASKKRLIATLKCCCRCQQLSRQLLVLFGELGHAVIGPRWLIAFGFGRLFHDDGIAVKPGEFVGQCNELIVGCSDPNFVQIGHVSHHAINDGIWVIDALGGKLLHVLIDLRCKSAKFIHALLTLEVQRSRDRLQPLASNQKICYLNGPWYPVQKARPHHASASQSSIPFIGAPRGLVARKPCIRSSSNSWLSQSSISSRLRPSNNASVGLAPSAMARINCGTSPSCRSRHSSTNSLVSLPIHFFLASSLFIGAQRAFVEALVFALALE